MAPQVRMKNGFLPSSHDHIALCAGISAKREKVPDTFSSSPSRGEVRVMPQDMVLGACPTVTFLLRRTAMSDRLLVRISQKAIAKNAVQV